MCKVEQTSKSIRDYFTIPNQFYQENLNYYNSIISKWFALFIFLYTLENIPKKLFCTGMGNEKIRFPFNKLIKWTL